MDHHAAAHCSLNLVTSALKILCKQIEFYHTESYLPFLFSGVKTLWPIQNNEAVITVINNLNNTKRVFSDSSFHFSNLYTNIPHDEWNMQWMKLYKHTTWWVKHAMNEVIDFCFKNTFLLPIMVEHK